jgi:hypothetical protein
MDRLRGLRRGSLSKPLTELGKIFWPTHLLPRQLIHANV